VAVTGTPRGETIVSRFLEVAGRAPGLPAVHLADVTLDYGELARRSRAVAAEVAALTTPGDRVALVAWNGLWWVEAYLGVPMAGRMLACISPRMTVRETRQMVEISSASLVIVDERVTVDTEALGGPNRRVIGLAEWMHRVAESPQPTPASFPPEDSEEPAWLMFTSGTTGAPKAAALSHANLLAAVDVTCAARPLPADDVYVFPFPLWHVAGYNVLTRLTSGRVVVLQTGFDVASIVADIAAHGATSMSLAATMLSALLDAGDADATVLDALRTLREIHYGAAPMPSTLLRRAAEVLGVDMWQGYGMTELAGNAVFLSAEDHKRGLGGDTARLAATGKPGPGVELAIVDESGAALPPGAIGEILVRGRQVMLGYWQQPEATSDALTSDGWLRTGDLGTLDGSGTLTVRDRKKDVIITGGENVSAREVEQVLREHPQVVDVAVVGVPDPLWGERVCAVVVTTEHLDVQELQGFARRYLAGFKVPREVLVTDRLPVNATGKVVKSDVRAWIERTAKREP
jgi:acyl-CoA synthetase (AMP-forming)/AMP-acid ligase II